MQQKYVITGAGEAILFPYSIMHIYAAGLSSGARRPLGAGFCDISNGVVNCFGRSDSLNIDSRGDLDALVISETYGLKVYGKIDKLEPGGE